MPQRSLKVGGDTQSSTLDSARARPDVWRCLDVCVAGLTKLVQANFGMVGEEAMPEAA